MASPGASRVRPGTLLRAFVETDFALAVNGDRTSFMVEIVGPGLGTIMCSASSYEAVLGILDCAKCLKYGCTERLMLRVQGKSWVWI